MKKYFTLFLVTSLIFLIITLVKADFLFIPTVYSVWKLILSLILLCLGFVFDAVAWHKTVNEYDNIKVRLGDSISSMGISVFGKYIPGKLWIVLGRAGYLSRRYDLNEKDCAVISLNTELISLWVSSLLAGLGVLLASGDLEWGILVLGMWLSLTFVVFTPVPYKILESVINKILKKPIKLPFIDLKLIMRVLHWFFIYWLLWLASFYFLVDALTLTEVSYSIGFIFAIGATVGIAVLFAPGGLGVREGIISAFLILCGLEPPVAATISIASRLWFLSGEVFIFSLGVVLRFLSGRG